MSDRMFCAVELPEAAQREFRWKSPISPIQSLLMAAKGSILELSDVFFGWLDAEESSRYFDIDTSDVVRMWACLEWMVRRTSLSVFPWCMAIDCQC